MNKKWWKAAGVRAIKTVAQTAVAMIGVSTLISAVDWVQVLSASALAGVLSILTSIAGLPEVEQTIKEAVPLRDSPFLFSCDFSCDF